MGLAALRYWASSRPIWFALILGPVLLAVQFGFYLITPRLLLKLPFRWRDVAPGAALCTAVAVLVGVITTFLLRNWFGVYGHAYGGFGVGLALMSAVVIYATFWVWIAATMGVYWQERAGPAVAATMAEEAAAMAEPELDAEPRPHDSSQVPSDQPQPPTAPAADRLT